MANRGSKRHRKSGNSDRLEEEAFVQERRVIRDAMERLLDGAPVRSDGKLTVKSLADEAGLKRWLLTHRHQDLQDEFRARIASIDSSPEPVRRLEQQLHDVKNRNEALSTELGQARAETRRLARLVNVLVVEKLQLEKTVQHLSGRLTGEHRAREEN